MSVTSAATSTLSPAGSNLDDETERFYAAVKIINGLPKEGPFQASNEMKLRFYALFKQATLGKCSEPKPGFWDVVRRSKWEAWNSLGDMPREEAMKGYIESLNQIIETMSLDSNVQEFLEKNDPLFEFVARKDNYHSPHVFTNGKVSLMESDFGHDRIPYPNKPNSVPNGHLPAAVNGHPSGNAEFHIIDALSCNQNDNMNDSAEVNSSDIPSEDENFADADDVCLSCVKAVVCLHNFIQTEFRQTLILPSVVVEASETRLHKFSVIERDCESAETVSSSPAAEAESGGVAKDIVVSSELISSEQETASSEKQLCAPGLDSAFDSHRVAIPACYEGVFNDAWAAVERAKNERQRRLVLRKEESEGTEPFSNFPGRKKGRKGRGRDDNSKQKSRNSASSSGAAAQGSSEVAGGGGQSSRWPKERSQNFTVVLGVRGSEGGDVTRERSDIPARDGSGSEESSGSGESPDMAWDPHVAAVMFRMHREVQQIGRQLDLMEGMLITQQRLLHSVLSKLLVHMLISIIIFILPF